MKYFLAQELVTPDVYGLRKERSYELFDGAALDSLIALREKFGPITVNNWHAGGTYKESGLRDPLTKTGALFSQHKFGRAFDCKFRNITVQEVFTYVVENPERFPLITCVEDVSFTPTWFHFDTRRHSRNGIWIIKP